MTFRLRSALALTLFGALIAPLPALAVATPDADRGNAVTFDTPTPTAAPAGAVRTPRPERTAEPTPAPEGTVPIPVPFAPGRTSLTVGYEAAGVLGQLPLLLALQRGYFEAAGFDEVILVQVSDPLADLRAGDLDVAVAGAAEAYPEAQASVPTRAIAGYQNYRALDGDYAGIVLMARQAAIADDPATLVAFLSAYIRALQDLVGEDGAAAALVTLQATDLAIDPDVAAEWLSVVGAYAPFDGGFGSLEDGGGLGELNVFLGGDVDSESELSDFVSQDPLNIAQAWLGLPANPANPFSGAPGVAEISVAMGPDAGVPSPIVVADAAGYFEDAGFVSIEIRDIEQPLPSVLSGQTEFAILDVVDAADALAQGLPLRVIAGHANYPAGPDIYGGDVVVVSSELLENEPSTVAAFLIAYLEGLGDLSTSVNATDFAPHDGGFGSRDDGAGLGELSAYLATQLGEEADLATLLATSPLHYAQTWWGIPANPVATASPEES